MDLPLPESFRNTYESLLDSLPQSLLIYGASGSGLGDVARRLAGKHARTYRPLDKKGEIDYHTGTISVETIRELYEKARGKSSENQVIIVEAADRMSIGAQNAFLKLLEEPIEAVHFILTTSQKDSLLPTILSRVQEYHLPLLSDEQSLELLGRYDLSPTEQRQLLFVASGRAELLTELATDKTLREKTIATMSDARQFLAAGGYEALTLALKHATNRGQAESFIEACLTILKTSIYSDPDTRKLRRAEQLISAKLALGRNANPKLQMMRVVLS